MNVSWWKISLLSVIIMAAAVVVAGLTSITTANQDRVIMGVQSDGTTIAGMTYDEVRSYYAKTAHGKLSRPAVVASCDNKTWKINPQDINLQADVEQAARAAYSIGRDGSPIANIITQLRIAITGTNVPLTGTYDEDKLQVALAQIKGQIERNPVNAAIQLQPGGTFKRSPAVIGRTIDMQPVAESLAPKLQALQLTVQAELTPTDTAPAIVDSDLSAIDTVLGSYTTQYAPGDRGDNITLAANHLQGVLVRSQATFSFNDTVGPRSRANGFKDAGVIIDGKHAIDSGGGVCQVSSTLYNAILLAGLTSVERQAHFFPSAYCPPGRDATVADNLIDFKFRNQLPHPVCLQVSNTGSSLTIYVLGTRADLGGDTLSLENTGSRQSPSIYRLWLQNGTVIEREFLHTDHYEA